MSESLKNRGALYAIAAYTSWGFVPLFWRELKTIPPLQILGHRILWSLFFFIVLFLVRKSISSWLELMKNRRLLLQCLPSAAAIGLNWGLYIYAVNSGHALESSLGYFINPVFNFLIGAVFFKEKLNHWKWGAFALACSGVLLLTLTAQKVPWIALSLAGTFSLYGVIRKLTSIKGTEGTAVESLMLVPVALLILSNQTLAPVNVLAQDNRMSLALLLSLGGALTALPLVWFAEAAQRLPLSTLGFYQYISPTFQFLIAVFVFAEHFDTGKLISFLLIWIGLALYMFDSVRKHIHGRKVPSSCST
ncbi:MAG: chloramphenicol resistance permease RarD [Pseudomonadota bacterium]|jgi:chloramphenicol-sensitive protein RarD